MPSIIAVRLTSLWQYPARQAGRFYPGLRGPCIACQRQRTRDRRWVRATPSRGWGEYQPACPKRTQRQSSRQRSRPIPDTRWHRAKGLIGQVFSGDREASYPVDKWLISSG